MLLETEYSSQDHVQNFIRLHLQQQDSIPVFLAAVISDMFSRQTFHTEMSESVSGVTHTAVQEVEEDVEGEQEVEEEEEIIEDEEEFVEEDDSGEEGKCHITLFDADFLAMEVI